MLTLVRLRVAGFRGFSHEQEFDLASPLTLLFGENGTGKSSALNALEWALFGKDCTGAATGIRERVGWEVLNRYASPRRAQVEAEFADDGGTYTVVRVLEPAPGGRLRERLQLHLPDGTTLRDEDAEDRLTCDLACSFRDFMTTVYQHQEAIRAVLVQEPRDRNDALDRLLGLSEYRNMLTGIESARISKEFKEASARRDVVSGEIGTALRLRERDLAELREEAENTGLDEADLTEDGGLRRASEFVRSLERFGRDSGLDGLKLEAPTAAEELGDFSELASRKLAEARGQMPALQVEQELLERRTTILRLQQDLSGLNADRQEESDELRGYERTHGSQTKLQHHVDELAVEEAKLQDRLRDINAKAPLIREAISFLETRGSIITPGCCPLCGNDAPNLLEEVRSEWEKLIGGEVTSLETAIGKARTDIREAKETLSAWRDAGAQLKQINDRLSTFREDASNALGVPIEERADVTEVLSRHLAEVQNRLEAVQTSVKERQQQIDRLDEQVGAVEIIFDFLELSKKIDRVDAIRESEGFQQVEAAFEDMAVFVADLDAIKRAIAETSNEEAETKVASATELIDEFFRKTADHPGLQKVVLEVTPDRRTARNSYEFVDEEGRDLLPILSQGDMNCLALSVFLGLASAAAGRSPFGLLVLDDPSQSLGPDEKRSLAMLLGRICGDRGVVVSTMDSELRDMLLEEAGRDSLVYNFAAWTPEDGPVVERARPR